MFSTTEQTVPAGYARVTDVLRPFVDFSGIPDFSRDGLSREEVLARAADRGTRVHAYCDMIANHLFVGDVDFDCLPYVDSFRAWFHENVQSVFLTEKRVNSKTHLLSGQLDLICTLAGQVDPQIHALIDIKTPSTTAKTWQLQTAAYRMLALDAFPELIGLRRFFLQLSRTGGKARLVEHTDVQDEKIFLGALHLHRFFGAKKNDPTACFLDKRVAEIYPFVI